MKKMRKLNERPIDSSPDDPSCFRLKDMLAALCFINVVEPTITRGSWNRLEINTEDNRKLN